MYSEEQINEWKSKAEKWDALGEKIASCYEDLDENYEEIPSEFEKEHGREPDLVDIGEIAAAAFGYL